MTYKVSSNPNHYEAVIAIFFFFLFFFLNVVARNSLLKPTHIYAVVAIDV